ncbi:MAG TPA: hypothetical protein VFQ68_12735 [Streptosporangiaceae bacterium]|nr:hypothetical protein [Streptosporangiaceae bacterium]
MIWDSGRVESGSTADVAYGGPPLAGGTRYGWKVQAWDETGAATGWSAPAAFETGISDRTGGWHASWISLGRIREEFRPPSEPGPSDPVVNALMPPSYLRREFRMDQPAVWARRDPRPDGTLYTDNLPVPPGQRPGTRHRRLRKAPGQAAPGRLAELGPRHLLLGPRPGRQRLAAGRRLVHVLTRPAAERHRERPHPQRRPGRGPRSAGAGPVSVAGYPDAPGATEAVFAVGSGSHEFTGPALTAEFSWRLATGYGR